MPLYSNENRNAFEGHVAPWENRKGLGWTVWRQHGHSRGLLGARIARQSARYYNRLGQHGGALAADVQRRCGLGRPSHFNRSDLPLLNFFSNANPPVLARKPGQETVAAYSSFTPRPLRRSIDGRSVPSFRGVFRASRVFQRRPISGKAMALQAQRSQSAGHLTLNKRASSSSGEGELHRIVRRQEVTGDRGRSEIPRPEMGYSVSYGAVKAIRRACNSERKFSSRANSLFPESAWRVPTLGQRMISNLGGHSTHRVNPTFPSMALSQWAFPEQRNSRKRRSTRGNGIFPMTGPFTGQPSVFPGVDAGEHAGSRRIAAFFGGRASETGGNFSGEISRSKPSSDVVHRKAAGGDGTSRWRRASRQAGLESEYAALGSPERLGQAIFTARRPPPDGDVPSGTPGYRKGVPIGVSIGPTVRRRKRSVMADERAGDTITARSFSRPGAVFPGGDTVEAAGNRYRVAPFSGRGVQSGWKFSGGLSRSKPSLDVVHRKAAGGDGTIGRRWGRASRQAGLESQYAALAPPERLGQAMFTAKPILPDEVPSGTPGYRQGEPIGAFHARLIASPGVAQRKAAEEFVPAFGDGSDSGVSYVGLRPTDTQTGGAGRRSKSNAMANDRSGDSATGLEGAPSGFGPFWTGENPMTAVVRPALSPARALRRSTNTIHEAPQRGMLDARLVSNPVPVNAESEFSNPGTPGRFPGTRAIARMSLDMPSSGYEKKPETAQTVAQRQPQVTRGSHYWLALMKKDTLPRKRSDGLRDPRRWALSHRVSRSLKDITSADWMWTNGARGTHAQRRAWLRPILPVSQWIPASSFSRASDRPWEQSEGALIKGTGYMQGEMPLARYFNMERDRKPPQEQPGRTPIQMSPQVGLIGGSGTPAPAASSQINEVSGSNELEMTGSPQSQMSLDDMVDKVWRKLMRKLALEQERGGWSRWV